MHRGPFLIEGLRLVGWPLLVAGLAEIAATRRNVGHRQDRAGTISPPWRALEIACQLTLAACFAAVFLYAVLVVLLPGIGDPVGRSIATISGWWAAGRPMYPDTATLSQYNVFPYGPLLFEIVGTSIKLFGPTMLAAKLPSLCVFAASTLGMFLVLRKHQAALGISLVVTQALVLVEGILCVWVRPDPFLIGIAVLCCSVLGSPRLKGWAGVSSLSILAGLAVALKFHGVFYVVPALVELVATEPKSRIAKLLGFCGITAAVSFLPFVLPGASLRDYLFVLKTASHDGVFIGIFVSNICFIATFMLAVHLLSPGLRDARYRRMMLSLSGCGVFVSIFAAKGGAGPHHLIPFLPYLGVLLADVLTRQPADTRRRKTAIVLFAAMLLGFQTISGTLHDLWVTQHAPSALITPDGLR